MSVIFVSDPSRNPKPTSKEGQEQNFGEGSAMAEPKPMSPVQAKARLRSLVCQVSHGPSLWSGRSGWTTALSNPEVPVKALTHMSGVDRSSAKPFEHDCDTSDNFKHSQVRKQENVQSTETLKQAKVNPSDGGFQRRLSTTANPIDTDKEFCSMRITDSDYIEKIFRFLQKKFGVQEGHESFSVRASKTNIMMCQVFVDECSNPSWTELQEKSGDLQVHEF